MDAIQGSGLDMSKLSDAEKRDLQQFVMNESQKIKIQQSTLMNLWFVYMRRKSTNLYWGSLGYSTETLFTCLKRWS